tara:strand:+ start:69 stop:272 length:204 start_codon:yes stop_codon:yes gene_type:complete
VDHGHHLQIQEQWVQLTPITQRLLVMLVLEEVHLPQPRAVVVEVVPVVLELPVETHLLHLVVLVVLV